MLCISGLGDTEIEEILVNPELSDIDVEFDEDDDDLLDAVIDREPDSDDTDSTPEGENDEPLSSSREAGPLWRHRNE